MLFTHTCNVLMLVHKTSLNTLEDRNYTKYLFRSQCYETRNLLQEEKWEKCKYVETKQHGTKTPISQPKKLKRKSENTLRRMKNKNTTFQRLWEAAKAVPKREVYINTALPQETREISNR